MATAKIEREYPHCREAEMQLIGCILIDETSLDRLPPSFGAGHFFAARWSMVFSAAVAARGQGDPVYSLSVEDQLRRAGQFERAGGTRSIVEAIGSVAHAADAGYLASLVMRDHARREAIRVATELIDAAYDGEDAGADPLDRAIADLMAITADGAGDSPATLAEVDAEYGAAMERRKRGEIEGFSTGLTDLDQLIGGMAPGRMIIGAARPGMGKTGLALNVAVAAARFSVRTLFVSQEMGRLELYERMVSSEGHIDNTKLRDLGQLAERDADAIWRRASEARGRLAALPIAIDDTPGRRMAQIEAAARRLHAREGLGFLVVDYVQLLEADPGARENRQETIAKISRRLKTLAVALRIPVFVLAQLNRDVEKREDKKPRMSDLRESGALEQDADQVILIHRPEYYDPNDRPGVADLIVGKNRWGPTGVVAVNFSGPTTRFAGLARQAEGQIPY